MPTVTPFLHGGKPASSPIVQGENEIYMKKNVIDSHICWGL